MQSALLIMCVGWFFSVRFDHCPLQWLSFVFSASHSCPCIRFLWSARGYAQFLAFRLNCIANAADRLITERPPFSLSKFLLSLWWLSMPAPSFPETHTNLLLFRHNKFMTHFRGLLHTFFHSVLSANAQLCPNDATNII